MIRPQTDRLLRLADFLDTVPPEQFDYNIWFNGTALGECGTTACALGWATAIPEFQALGLELRSDEPWPSGESRYVALRNTEERGWKKCSEEAAEVVFGLTKKQHDFVFLPDVDDYGDGYEDDDYDKPRWSWRDRPTEWAQPKDVAEHIRNFVSNVLDEEATITCGAV